MAKITIEELSDSLKEYLSGLGLTEEQVNSLVQNKLGDLSNLETVNKDNIVNSVNEVKDTVAFVGTAIFGSDMSDDTLMTDSNTVIGAINELFQRGNNVKQSLVEALIAKEIEASTSEGFESLINKISSIQGGSIGYATGEGSVTFIVTSSESKLRNAKLDKPFGFTPTHIILVFDNGAILTNKTTSNNPLELNTENYVYIDSMTSDTLTFNYFSGMNQYSHDFIYYAFDANSSSSESGNGNNIEEQKIMTYGTDHILVSSAGYEARILTQAASDTLVIPALPYEFEGATLYMKGKTSGAASDSIWFRINILDSDNNNIKTINDDYLLFKNTDTEFTFNIDTLQAGYKVYVEATIYNPYEPMSIATEDPTLIATVSEISIRYNLK